MAAYQTAIANAIRRNTCSRSSVYPRHQEEGWTMKKTIGFTCLVTLLSGCGAFAVDVQRAPNAPTLPPASSAEIVHAPPADARELGTIDAQGNNWQSASDCEARLILEA